MPFRWNWLQFPTRILLISWSFLWVIPWLYSGLVQVDYEELMEGTFSPSVAEEIRKRGPLAAIVLLVRVSWICFWHTTLCYLWRIRIRSNLEVVFSCGEWQSQDFTIPNMAIETAGRIWCFLPRMVQVRSNPYQSWFQTPHCTHHWFMMIYVMPRYHRTPLLFDSIIRYEDIQESISWSPPYMYSWCIKDNSNSTPAMFPKVA